MKKKADDLRKLQIHPLNFTSNTPPVKELYRSSLNKQ